MKQKKLIIDIINYIDSNIYTKISIDTLSSVFFFNKDYIMRLFKRELGITINQYINYKRVFLSLPYLENSNDSMLYIALNNGFYSLEYYSEMFKNIIGISPSKYRDYYKFRKNVDLDTFYKINNNKINLTNIIKNIDNYKRIIVKKDVLKLSIFK